MSLIIGNVLPLRDRMCAKAVMDMRGDPDDLERAWKDIRALPHGSVVDIVEIVSGGDINMMASSGSSRAAAFERHEYRAVRCDGKYGGTVGISALDVQSAPEEIQESGVWVVGQMQDGFRAVAQDPDAASIDDVLDEIVAAWEEDGTVAGLPPLSMIEVHGPVKKAGGRAVVQPSSGTMVRWIVVIGEDGTPCQAPLSSVVQPDGEDDGGDDIPR